MLLFQKLSKEQNFWLKNLTDDLGNREAVEELAKAYQVTTERACEMLGTTVEEYQKACELLGEDMEE